MSPESKGAAVVAVTIAVAALTLYATQTQEPTYEYTVEAEVVWADTIVTFYFPHLVPDFKMAVKCDTRIVPAVTVGEDRTITVKVPTVWPAPFEGPDPDGWKKYRLVSDGHDLKVIAPSDTP